MKILMIIPSSSQPETQREYILGLPYLASALRVHGYHNIRVLNYFHMPWSETERLTIKTLEDFNPDVVLISCFTINRVSGHKTAILSKKYNPSIKVIMGGMHPAFLYDQILSNFPVDAVCIGEGEQTIVELIDAFKSNSPLDGIKGIAFKKDSTVLLAEKRPFIKDLDMVPFPAHDIYKDYIVKTRKAHIISSRGCPFGCQFCSTTQFWGKTWRSRSSKNVVDEIEMLIKNYNIDYINFMDDEFTLNKRRTIEISKEIINRGIAVKWSCSTRVDTIDREQLEWMIKGGCEHMALGIESGSPRMIKSIGKKITVDQIEKAFNLLSEYGLSKGAFMMVGNPGEDRSSVNETIRLVKKLKLDQNSVGVAEIYPGTRLYEIAKSKNFITDDYWLTENPPPFYTVEHSAIKLKLWAFLIILNSKIAQGAFTAIRFIVTYLISKRRKIVKIIYRTFVNKTSYMYKEY